MNVAIAVFTLSIALFYYASKQTGGRREYTIGLAWTLDWAISQGMNDVFGGLCFAFGTLMGLVMFYEPIVGVRPFDETRTRLRNWWHCESDRSKHEAL